MFEGILQIIKYVIIFSIVSFVFLELCPKEEYKKYISFFTGLVMIIMVMTPIVQIFNGGNEIDSTIDEFYIAGELKDMKNVFQDYDELRVDSVVYEYQAGIVENISEIVASEGLLANNVEVVINTDVDSEGFLNVTKIDLLVSKKYEDSSVKIREIVLEQNRNTESVEIINIKNKISQFYNISPDNININK